MNDFEKMCKKLEKNKKKSLYNQNRYTYAKSEVKKFVGKDADKLMLIKSEAQGGNFSEYTSVIMSFTALAISVVNTLFVMQPADSFCLSGKIYQNIGADGYEIIEASVEQMGNIENAIIAAFIAIIFFVVGALCKKFINVYMWRKYILTAVEELEKQFK